MNPNSKGENQAQERYLTQLLEIYKYSTTQFDKYVLLLSTGALVISVGFLNQVIPLNQAKWTVVLYVGWISMVLTILFALLSQYFAMRAAKRMISAVQDEEDLVELYKVVNKPLVLLNKACIIFVVIGISFIVLFAILNIHGN